ncbi:hypothetical protein [Anaerobutyricum hallii]|uniref:hypothetical protein n=1 Tax=Anaerobutyricum hallii TaxID=39488 RepID=UPI003993C329
MVKMDYRKIKKALETLSDMCDEITRDSYADSPCMDCPCGNLNGDCMICKDTPNRWCIQDNQNDQDEIKRTMV